MQQEVIEGFRLSPHQRHLWLLQQGETNFAYRAQCSILIEGRLERAVLLQAIDEIVRRHEILRTGFRCLAEMTIPLQVIGDAKDTEVRFQDLSRATSDEQAAQLETLMRQACERALHLNEPNLQLDLVTLSPERHQLFVSLPALCADATGLRNLVREISRTYAALSAGEELGDEATQYADLSEWLNELAESEESAVKKAYWDKLDLSALGSLKLDFKLEPALRSAFAPRVHELNLSAAQLVRLEEYAREHQTSVAVVLLACWMALVWRLTGRPDVIVGAAYDGRNYAELEEAVGLLTRFLPISCALDANLAFGELLTQLDAQTRDAYGLQDFFGWEAGGLKDREQDEASPSFFPICFDYADVRETFDEGAGVVFSVAAHDACVDRFHLKLRCVNSLSGLNVQLHFDPEVYRAEDVLRTLERFQTLLESALEKGVASVGELELVGATERHKLLVEWNAERTEYPVGKCLHQLFEAQVERTPERTAVVCDGTELSFEELNRRANQLAARLRELGVGPESRVGLLLERSVEMLVGVLGILKAGGAYVPLDPKYPQERLAYMLEDAKVQVLVTQDELRSAAPEHVRCLCMDIEWDEIAGLPVENCTSEVSNANLIYVIYTSGSTGVPKGVAIEHRQLVNYLHGVVERLEIPEGANFALVSTFAADLGHTSIFPSLCNGGCLHIIPQEQSFDAERLADYFQSHAIDCLKIVPTHLQALLTSPRAAEVMPRARLILGGEATSVDLFEKLRGLIANGVICNHYGPTETTVGVIASMHRGDFAAYMSSTLPLGRPLGNSRLYLLDAMLRPVPIGIAGEVYIGGDGLARGYLGKPAETAEKFIPNPLSETGGERLYMTGDLARYLPDGQVEFLGRIDEQVKIRGFRIELGEIEAALRRHVAIREVFVMAREEASGNKRLVAYVEAVESTAPGELRSYLGEKLPDYMIPASFVFLDALPLNANGKVDRAALPAPEQAQLEPADGLPVLRSPVEEMLLGIWAKVLGVESVGVDDNFFELGGHSLLATQLISRAREAFGVELSLSNLFEAPTVAELSPIVEAAMGAAEGLQVMPMICVSRANRLPLSYAQQRVWFINQLAPESTAYNIPIAIRIKGRNNVAVLERTLREIVNRHEALRTTFISEDGQPVQLVSPELQIALPVIDLSAVSEDVSESLIAQLALQEAQSPFDLAQGPLLRTTLIWLDAEHHVLLFTVHHIVCDAWSKGILIRELALLYEAFLNNIPMPPLPELTLQYADFAAWQQEWLQGDIWETQLAYWKEQLGGTLPVLTLPTDNPRPSVQTFRGETFTLDFGEEFAAHLRQFSRRRGVTLFMALLAAFKVLLHRYTGQHNILVGTPIANRSRGQVESIVGLFLNTIVLRSNLSGDPIFDDYLVRLRATALKAYAHQDLPFEKLVEELQPERELSHTPLFQVMFILQNATLESLNLSGLMLTPLQVDSKTAKFDLTLSMSERADGLTAAFEYNLDLFSSATIERMGGHFRTLLESVINDPRQRISELMLLTADETRQLLFERNDTERSYNREACVHELFESQAERMPENVAVVFEGRQLNYRELNRRANQLARHLRAQGVGPETKVGICIQRSVEVVVGLLGILKSGGAYIPLNPASTKEQLNFRLVDAQIPVLLTEQNLIEKFSAQTARTILIDTDWPEIAGESDRNFASGVTSRNLAYVIYTSGSTGKHKGVQIEHQAVVNFFNSMAREPGFTSQDIVLAITTLSFDIAALELLLPLTLGARVLVLSRDVASEGRELLKALRGSGVNVIQATPATWRMLLDAGWNGDAQMRMLCGGEALPLDLAQQLLKKGNSLWNLYGPTETTIWSAVCRIDEQDTTVSIGHPIDNTQLYFLDEALQLVPMNVVGELYIGGEGLARGYIGRPEQTAEKFVPHPFSSEPGARLYRTGDRGRVRGDGQVEYLGRLDSQVKVRGHRIELGEIEAALLEHAEVREAVVIVREEGGEKRLVGYVVREEGGVASGSELRQHVKERLPEYMIPQWVVMMDEMPLTANGKIDRKALPPPAYGRTGAGVELASPRTPVEELLCGIWCEVLQVPEVGIHDNFFDLGGHSLLATQVISRVREAFEVEIALRSLFEAPTVALLGEQVEGLLRQGAGLETPALVRRRSHESAESSDSGSEQAPLSFAQQRLWFLHQLEPESAAYNIPMAVRLTGPLDRAALQRAFNKVVQRHEVLRTSFAAVEGRPVQVIRDEQGMEMPLIDLGALDTEAAEEETRRLARSEGQKGFALEQWPVMRVRLVKVREEEHVVLLTMHHIISDGWSMGVLVQEMGRLYEQYERGEEGELEELEVQYGDYARWQREWLRGEELEKQLSYWREKLMGLERMRLPTDRPRPPIQSFEGETLAASYSTEMTEALRELGRRNGATLFMTLLAAFKTMLYRYAWQDTIVVGTPIANRNRRETERLIGFFVNTLVIRTNLSDDPTFRELLGRVREGMLGAYAHQDVPFEKLVDELRPERSLSYSPLFQVFFALNNNPRYPPISSSLTTENLTTHGRTARFDLEWSMEETADGLAARIIYNTDLFDASTISQMREHYEQLLSEVVSNPDRRLLEFSLPGRTVDGEGVSGSVTQGFHNTDQFAF